MPRGAHESIATLATGGQYCQDLLQALANLLETLASALGCERKGSLRLCRLGFRFQVLTRAWDGEALFIQKLLDSQRGLRIALTVHALTGATLYGFQLRKLCFPKTKHIGWQPADLRDLANAEIQLVRN